MDIMRFFVVPGRRAVRASAIASVVALGAAVPAQAGTSVSIGGDSNWTVTATATTSANYVTLGTSVTGTSKIVFDAHFLGIPLPVTGYYVNSFPDAPFPRPTLISADAPLSTGTTYQYFYNSYLGKYAWEVRGKDSFWGDKTVNLKGSGKTDARTSGYFLAGTYPCGSGCTNANAIQLVKVS
jgi:hypothetical protein